MPEKKSKDATLFASFLFEKEIGRTQIRNVKSN